MLIKFKIMKIFITRKVSESGIEALKAKGYEVTINLEDRVLAKE